MKRITLAQPKKVEADSSQNRTITNDQHQKLKESAERHNRL